MAGYHSNSQICLLLQILMNYQNVGYQVQNSIKLGQNTIETRLQYSIFFNSEQSNIFNVKSKNNEI